jgi:tetratricopeptide (TPR) repeat protein
VYPLRRLGREAGGWWSPQSRRSWLEKIPFVVASAVAIPIALVAARSGANLVTMAILGPLDRLAVSLYGLVFYLWKTVVPLGLSPFYPLMTPIAPFSMPYVLSGFVVAVVTALSILLRRRCPTLLAVWIVYVVTVLPVAGILQNGPQISADRYSYLPSLSLAILAGAGVLGLRRAATSRRRTFALFAASAGILVVMLLTALTWRQVAVWRDPERLWSHALASGPSSTAHEHLGYLRRLEGRLPEAIDHYRIAASLQPGAASIRIQWGNALAQQGMLAEAIDRYREALHLAPGSAAPQYHWGNALVAAGRLDEAFAHYREAVRIDPANAEAQNSWGRALAQAGRWDEAIARYQEAVRLKPHSVPYYNWGNALFAAGRLDEAIVQYRESIRMDPSAAEAYNNWGRALAQQGKWEDAITRYREALRIRPNYPLATANLDQALSQLSKASTR